MRDGTRHEKVEEAPGFTESGIFGPYKFIRLKSGRKMTFWDAMRGMESAQSAFVRNCSRAFKMLSSEWDLETIERQITHMEEYTAAVRHFVEQKRGEQAARERIAQLRDTTGRTPEEAEAFHRKADKMEQELQASNR